MPRCEKEILTHCNPVEPDKVMRILTCKIHKETVYWEQADFSFHDGVDQESRFAMNWARHLALYPQVDEPVEQSLDFQGTNTPECQWEITRLPPATLHAAARFALRCKKHGGINWGEVLPTVPIYQVRINLECSWWEHLAAKNLIKHQPNIAPKKQSLCEKLIVERTDSQSGDHFVILLCKSHGQICEKPLTAANSWHLQQEMDKEFNQHKIKAAINGAPNPLYRPATQQLSPYAPRFGSHGKRKFG